MSVATPFYRRIEDYAIIGNCRTAALISREGSLDWLCLPRFDSPSLFARLLDVGRGGFFRVCPAGQFSVSRCYIEDTSVLQTTFSTVTGALRLTDFMPVASEEQKSRLPWPDHQILRLLEVMEGEVEVEILCDPRPDYGRSMPQVRNRQALGFWFEYRDHLAVLLGDLPLQQVPSGSAVGCRVVLRERERRVLSFVYAHGEPAILPPIAGSDDFLQLSVRWWRQWSSACSYRGSYRSAVIRSALTLKLLSYAPSGAVVAAATTSLPEAVGARRNYDYRYCWLRDASWTLRALHDLGFRAEAEAFLRWLLQATRLTWPEVQTVYDVFGEARLPETTLQHLEGYKGSRPVHTGNSAWQQFQLDIYGELIAAAFEFAKRGGDLDPGEGRMLVGLGKVVARRWREPDKGIWEIPGSPRHFTYSKAMAWVALDRLLQLRQRFALKISAEDFQREREAIRQAVEESGFDAGTGSYIGSFGRPEMDAALLQLPRVGYVAAGTERMRVTAQCIHRSLERNGLLKRYATDYDELPSVEGSFGICNFWKVSYLFESGNKEAARQEFERYLALGNDLGLYSEEIDPVSGAFLGNFPQAFTHVGLINAALLLEGGQEEPAGGEKTPRK